MRLSRMQIKSKGPILAVGNSANNIGYLLEGIFQIKSDVIFFSFLLGVNTGDIRVIHNSSLCSIPRTRT